MYLLCVRFGHSQVNTHLWRYEEDGKMSSYGHVALRDVYFSPERLKREGGVDPLLRGAVRQAAQEVDLKVCCGKRFDTQIYLSIIWVKRQ